jgi:hypothetical protein
VKPTVKDNTKAAPSLASSTSPSAILTADDLKLLKSPFAKDRLGVKVQSYSKDRTRAMLVLYLQHTDVQDRLEEVDPCWSSEVVGTERSGDTFYVRTRLTLKQVSRENVGEGGDPKSAYSDALKRAAMLFGVGRYLYDSATVWTEYNDQRDRFKQWSVDDYERAARGQGHVPGPQASATVAEDVPLTPTPTAAAKPKVTPKKIEGALPGLRTEPKLETGKSREQYNRVLMNLYRPYLTKYPETRFVELLYGRYNVGETRLMTLEQMEDLVQFMEGQLSENQNIASHGLGHSQGHAKSPATA